MIFLLVCAVALAAQLAVIVAHRLYQRRLDAFAARVRGEITGPLVDLLASEVTASARDAFLAHIPSDSRARAVVADLLLETMPKLRGSARDELAELFDEAGFTAQYLHGLSSSQAWRRAVAAQALGNLGARRAAGDLLNLLADPAPDVRLAAARALGKLGMPEVIEPLIQAYTRGALAYGPVATSILRIGHAAGLPLIDYLHHPEPEVRALAARLLGVLDVFEAGPSLVEALSDEDARMRTAAAGSIGRLGIENAALPLMRALSDDRAEVRLAAVAALGQGEDHSVAGVLRLALSDEVYEVRRAAADALVALGAPGIAELIGVLSDGEEMARAHAVEALERSGHADQMLQRWLEAQPGVPLAAAGEFLRALAAAGGQAPFEAAGVSLDGSGMPVRRVPADDHWPSQLAGVAEE